MKARGCGDEEIIFAARKLPNQFGVGPLQTIYPENTISLAEELYAVFVEYRAKTPHRPGKITGVVGSNSAISGGFRCRSVDGLECYKTVVNAIERFVFENPPKDVTWQGNSKFPSLGTAVVH